MKRKIKLSATQIIAAGFLLTILIGAFILALPISSAGGTWTSFTDALFTATTSVCVTGLVTVSTAYHWSVFGQIIILLLIQIGGLGIIAITTSFLLIIRRKIALRDAVLLENAFNLDSLGGIVSFLKKVMLFAVSVELAAFVPYAFVFVKDFGAVGLWYALFHSVSSFCNAGMDIIGDSSLYAYSGNVIVNLVTMLEIVLGGIGFIVVFDIFDVFDMKRRNMLGKSRVVSRFSLHTKVVLITTAVLIFGGGLLFFLFEMNNGETIGNMSLGNQIMASLFQSVTSRTAGFATIPQASLTNASTLLTCILMFIGGSPIGTAGGIKTTTVVVMLFYTAQALRGKRNTSVGKRRIGEDTARKAVSVFTVAMLAVTAACMLMFIFTDGGAMEVLFEVISALGTVGLSRDFTAALGLGGKYVIILCMYLGRIGPISLVLLFSKSEKEESMHYGQENIVVG